VPQEPDFESMGLGPAYRSLTTFGQADDLVYEFATNRIATPGRPTQHWVEVCLSRFLIRSLRVGQRPEFRVRTGVKGFPVQSAFIGTEELGLKAAKKAAPMCLGRIPQSDRQS
jgi:hypothetical protein